MGKRMALQIIITMTKRVYFTSLKETQLKGTRTTSKSITFLRMASDTTANSIATSNASKKNSKKNTKNDMRNFSPSQIRNNDMRNFPPSQIRNIAIIAHVDHGKSTLADRMMEITGTIPVIKGNQGNKQVLDDLQVERDRGITVKAQTVSMFHQYNGKNYLINLIDTPGHLDFSYEVSRSLSACQGVILLIDATQGIQSQTLANFHLASTKKLKILPILNKVDLETARIEKVAKSIHEQLDLPKIYAHISAKTGQGVSSLLEAIIKYIPSPSPPESKVELRLHDMTAFPLSALLFDTRFDPYAGVICHLAITSGILNQGDRITSSTTGKSYDVNEVGILRPAMVSVGQLSTGQVGYVKLNLRVASDAQLGDTFYHSCQEAPPSTGTKLTCAGSLSQPTLLPAAKHVVFAGIYPLSASLHANLAEALIRLALTDASLLVEKESSMTLGVGFRLGFLGTLHLDVVKQRLLNEHGVEVICTIPTVKYKIVYKNGTAVEIKTAAEFPDPEKMLTVSSVNEPMILGTITSPAEYLGKIITLCEARRGVKVSVCFSAPETVTVVYRLPHQEILTDFHDSLKSLTSGFATFQYTQDGWEQSDIVRVCVFVNGLAVDALSCLCHRENGSRVGKMWVSRLSAVLGRELFEVTVQARIDGETRFVAKHIVKAARKDVTAKLYGGDVTRKNKLLDKQKEGKKKMKSIAGTGKVELSQKVFLALLK